MGARCGSRWLTDLAVGLVVVAAGTWTLPLRSTPAGGVAWLSVVAWSLAAVAAATGWWLQRRADPVRRIVGRLPVKVSARSLWWQLTTSAADD